MPICWGEYSSIVVARVDLIYATLEEKKRSGNNINALNEAEKTSFLLRSKRFFFLQHFHYTSLPFWLCVPIFVPAYCAQLLRSDYRFWIRRTNTEISVCIFWHGRVFFFFFTHILAFYFGMREHESALHDCSECETVRFFFPDENPVQKYEWVWNSHQYADLCFICGATQFWYMPWRRVIDFFFLLVGRTRLSCMWACILLPANSSGSTHARRINKTIKETKLYLDKKFQSKKFDFYKLAV